MAHVWRAPVRLQGLSGGQRLRSPSYSLRVERECGFSFEPALQFAHWDELASATTDAAQLGHDVLVQVVAADTEGRCGLVWGKCEARGWGGGPLCGGPEATALPLPLGQCRDGRRSRRDTGREPAGSTCAV